MTRPDIDEFVKCFKPDNRNKRKSTWSEGNQDGRWRGYTHDEIVIRAGSYYQKACDLGLEEACR